MEPPRAPVTAGPGRRAALELALVAVVSALGALAFGPMFAGRRALVPLAVTAALPAAFGLGLSGARRWARLTAGGAAFVLFAAFAAYGGPAGVVSLPGALTSGPARIFTATVPVEPRGHELAVVLIAVWVASAAAAELVLARRTTGLLPGLPPVVLFVLALVAGAGGPEMPVAVPALLVAGLAGMAVLRSTPLRPPGARAHLASAAVVLVVAVIAAAAGPRLPGADSRDRYDPRAVVDPVVARPAASPLARFSSLLTGPPETAFTARTGDQVQHWRLAALDRFDGQLWSSGAGFRRAGRSLPPDEEVDVPTHELAQTVVLDRLDSFFLPAADRPTEVSVGGLGFDPGSGTLLVPRGRPLPRRYRVVSAVARPTAAQLRLARSFPLDAEGAGDLPPLPAPLRQLAQRLTADATSAFGRPAALQQYFRTAGFTYDASADAPSGHSLFHINQLLTTRRGTAEQYASAFAVLARSLGYETRVAVGFRPGQFDPGTGTYTVRTTDVHAWPEVRFRDVGWVAFEPIPSAQAAPTAEGAPQASPPVQEAVAGEEAARDARISPGNKGQAGEQASPSGQRRVPWPLLVAAFALLLALAVPTAILGAKARRRRRRRRAPTPAARVVGAWHEAVDRLQEAAVAVSRAMTADEVVVATSLPSEDGVGPGRALHRLAAAANGALFGPAEVTPEAAEAAWAWQAEVAAGTRRGVPPWARVRLALSPAPLLAGRNGGPRGRRRGP